MEKGWRVEKCSTSTTTDVVKTLKKKTLKRKKKKSVKKETRKSFKEEEENLPAKSTGIYICVKGFDASLPTDAIKTALTNHFGPCGVIYHVLVPKQCRTSASNGFAHVGITTRDEDKALALDGSLLGGRRLEVRRAIIGRPGNNLGCKTCPLVLMDVSRQKGFVSPENLLQFKKRCEEVHQSNNQ